MVLSLSKSNLELSTGKRYRWQVELVCPSHPPSSNLFAESEIEVVPIQAKLRQHPDQLNRRHIYSSESLVRRPKPF